MTRPPAHLAALAVMIAVTSIAGPVEARDAGAFAAGAALGLITGSILGAHAAPPLVMAPPPAYEPRPVYHPPHRMVPMDEEPACWAEQRRVFVEGRGWSVRSVEVCE